MQTNYEEKAAFKAFFVAFFALLLILTSGIYLNYKYPLVLPISDDPVKAAYDKSSNNKIEIKINQIEKRLDKLEKLKIR
jgi:hypothetical protein